jgi:hypothetical protein
MGHPPDEPKSPRGGGEQVVKRLRMVPLIVCIPAVFAGTCLVLALVYSLRDAMRFSEYPTEHWLRVYVLMALLMTTVTVLVAAVGALLSESRGITLAAVCGISTFGILAVYAYYVGNIDVDKFLQLPLQAANGYFFREWKFLKFCLFNAPAQGLLSAATYWVVTGDSTRTVPTSATPVVS